MKTTSKAAFREPLHPSSNPLKNDLSTQTLHKILVPTAKTRMFSRFSKIDRKTLEFSGAF
jgi:hypothetical protein